MLTAYALLVDETLLIYEGIREHAKMFFLHFANYFWNIFIKLIPCYELPVAIHSPSGRKTAHDIFYCALPMETAG